MEIVFFVLTLAVIFTPVFLIGRWILGPIDQAARQRQAPVRFSIGDFLCLFLAVQIPLTAVYQLIDEEVRGAFWVFTIISWIVAPTIWYACARALSKAGVLNGRHRFIFLGVVMPVVYYGLIPFVLLTVAAVIRLYVAESTPLDKYALWLVTVWLLLAGVFYLCGLLTRWMVRRAHGCQDVNILAGGSDASIDSALPPTLGGASHWQDNSTVG